MPKYEIVEIDSKTQKETGLMVEIEAANKSEAATKTLMAAMKQGDSRACKGIADEVVYPQGVTGPLIWVIKPKTMSFSEQETMERYKETSLPMDRDGGKPWSRPLTNVGRPPSREAAPPKETKLSLEKLKDIESFWATEVRREMPDKVDDSNVILEFAREHVPQLIREVYRLRELVKGRNLELQALLIQMGGKATIELDTQTSINPSAKVVGWKDVSNGKWHMIVQQPQEARR